MTIAADINAALADLETVGLGVEVTYSGTTVNGVLDKGPGTMADRNGFSVELEPESVLIRTGALSPPIDATIVVDGASYKVREIRPEPIDGKLTRIILVPA